MRLIPRPPEAMTRRYTASGSDPLWSEARLKDCSRNWPARNHSRVWSFRTHDGVGAFFKRRGSVTIALHASSRCIPMNWADYLIIGIIAISALISLVRGFVREVVSIV